MGMLAIALLLAGMAILAGYGLYELLATIAEQLSGPVRVAIVLLVVGFILFIVALLRARLKAARECDDGREPGSVDREPHTHPEKHEQIK